LDGLAKKSTTVVFFVIPAKAGIQVEKTGFRIGRHCRPQKELGKAERIKPGMTEKEQARKISIAETGW
jgi:hypothetical protein